MVTAATDRAGVLVPGGGYSADGPPLMYAGLAVRRRGGQVMSAVELFLDQVVWPQGPVTVG